MNEKIAKVIVSDFKKKKKRDPKDEKELT